MRKRTDPYDSMEFQSARTSFQGLHETELDHLGRFRLPTDYISELKASGAHKLVLEPVEYSNFLIIIPSDIGIGNKRSLGNLLSRIAGAFFTPIPEEVEASWDEDGNVTIPSSIMSLIDFSISDKMMLCGDGTRLELWRYDEWEAREENKKWILQKPSTEHDRRTLDAIVSIIKEKENSPYAKLRKIYGYLNGLIVLLGIAVAIGAIHATAHQETLAQKLMIWLSIVLLFYLPWIAHSISIVSIDLKTPTFPIVGLPSGKAASRLKGPYLACVGFAASGVACWIVATVPQLDTAIKALPLGWLYLPVMLVAAVMVPFMIWLLMSALAWRARKDPFGP